MAFALVMSTLAGCAVGPDYKRPEAAIPASYKEAAEGWKVAQPADQQDRGPWWTIYNDPQLNALEDKLDASNQTIAQFAAAYRQARALTAEARSAYFPVVTLNGSGERQQSPARSGGFVTGTGSVGSSGQITNSFRLSGDASWEPDLWGQVSRTVAAQKAGQQSAAADLANARLSAQATLAQTYFTLRSLDAQQKLLDDTVASFERSLQLTQNRYGQGVAARADVIQAQTQLQSAQAAALDIGVQRAQLEHAIAVLLGVPPANFSIAPDPHYAFLEPEVPLGVPSQLLERRYDVVAAERTAASSNALIGAAEAAFFPTVTLSAQGGFQHNTIANLFSLPNRFWTLGPDIAETIFDGGARTAAVREARATYDQNVALYRNTVLTAFQNVEDSLSSVNHLRQQSKSFEDILQRNQQLFASERAQFDVGSASQQDLLTQQLTLLLAEQNLSDTQALLTQSSVTLIRNLGGGWDWNDVQTADAGNAHAPEAGTSKPQETATPPPQGAAATPQ